MMLHFLQASVHPSGYGSQPYDSTQPRRKPRLWAVPCLSGQQGVAFGAYSGILSMPLLHPQASPSLQLRFSEILEQASRVNATRAPDMALVPGGLTGLLHFQQRHSADRHDVTDHIQGSIKECQSPLPFYAFSRPSPQCQAAIREPMASRPWTRPERHFYQAFSRLGIPHTCHASGIDRQQFTVCTEQSPSAFASDSSQRAQTRRLCTPGRRVRTLMQAS